MKSVKFVGELLGMKVRDKVTGAEGVVSSVSFDLFGCIQAVVVPQADKDGKRQEGDWFDVGRLEITDANRVMPVPDFDAGYPSEGKKGPAHKPA